MKKFKKKHSKIPSEDVIRRLLGQIDEKLVLKYHIQLRCCPEIIPEPIRRACLARFDPNRRTNICYYPDLHNFRMYDSQNRSLPVDKFLNLFRAYVDSDVLDRVQHDLTNYRLEFYTDPDKWYEVYADSREVESCMTRSSLSRCYSHPENNLALAALYAPGSNVVVARSIVNQADKWYVRLFGDSLLVTKLKEMGYNRISDAPPAFKMYAYVGGSYINQDVQIPYFDFPCSGLIHHPETHDPATGYIEITVNPGE